MRIKTVTVIGATGTMGANVTGIFASFGDARVYCVGRSKEKVEKTIPRIVASVRAESIRSNLIPADFNSLDECVRKSDLIFESVPEDLEKKKSVAKIVSANMREGAISCTGSSGLSITELANCYPEKLKKQFFGVHMFNPPYSMPLCELVCTEYTESKVSEELKLYLSNTLLRTVVEVKDSPAFLANRIGFQLINEALQLAEKYKDNGGIDYIDAIMGPFTGRAMAPLVTSDFVGLDVHKAIVNNIYGSTYDYARDSFKLPEYVEELINKGALGRKRGGGLYKLVRYENGLKRMTVYDISSGMYRDTLPYTFPFANQMKALISEGEYQKAIAALVDNHSAEAEICLNLLLKYIVYSLYCAKIVGFAAEAADDVMAMGFNWCPPIAMFEAINSVSGVDKLIEDRLPDLHSSINVKELFSNLKPSKYDYRRYFKSGR